MSAVAVLKRPQFRRIFFAQSISTFGDNVAPIAIAIAFAVLAVRHSAADLGLVLAARTLPMAVFVIFGGVWADRLPRKTLMVASDLTRLGTQGVFALLLLQTLPALWALMLLQALNGTATAFFRPASSGLVQEAVPASERQRANGLLSAATNISSIAGPAVAAVLIAVVGNAWAVGADALSFGLSAAFLVGVKVPPRAPVARSNVFREIGEGFKAVVAQRWLGLEILGFAQFQVFILASYAVLGPLIANRSYSGAATWALIASISGVGALIGDAVSLRFTPRRPLVATNCLTLLCIPLFVALALTAPVPVLAACGLLFGFGLSLPDTFWFTAMQDNVPEHLMARVSAFDWMGSMVLRPIGLAVIAPIAVLIAPGTVLLIAAGATIVTLAGITLSPSVRNLAATSRTGAPNQAPPSHSDGAETTGS